MGDSKCWWASGLSDDGAAFRAAFDTFLGKGGAWWATPELRVDELITAIQPNRESEFRRQAIVDFITKLIQSCVNCQVVKFGSVPLKTYLPDGDIDLTVVSPSLEAKPTWVDDVHDVLQKEINNPKSEFRITQVQRIAAAEVKLIKIYVGKLLVDVSFNQLGGVCTLCFLEEVDRLIGENHLFKRSIILVKAWCYYESRLLGANCNLMSTYALETLVLYIFHLFHASLRGPLQVLYLFLEFFSSFDWDKYCVSLSGPVSYSKDTESLAMNFQSLAGGEGGKLLFTKDFLNACELFYGSMRVKEDSKTTEFPVKSLNIIDPLRRTNNLGRSVNQGNCARIRRAFVHGARTLRGILQGSEADVCSALDQFFKNCNERFDGSTPRPDCAVSRSWPGTRISNGVQRMGGGRRTDNARTVSSKDAVPNGCVSENGDYSTRPRPNPNGLRFDPTGPTVRETNNSARYLTSVVGKEVAALSLRDTENGPNGDHTAHDSRHIDEELTRSDGPVSRRIPIVVGSVQIDCDALPIRSSVYGESEVSSGTLSERISSANNQMKGQESSARNMGGANVSKQFSTAFDSQHSRVSSASPRSKFESEEEKESSSQSSSSKGEVTASNNVTVLGVSDTRRGLLPLSCRPENFERRHGSSSELQGRLPDPQRSPLDVSGAETDVQTPSTHGKPLKSIRIEGERDFSVPVDEFIRTGNHPGFETPNAAETSQSQVPAHKEKIHQQYGTLQSNDFGSGSGHVKRKRGPGQEKRHGRAAGMVAQDGGQVSNSGVTAHSPHQSSGLASGYQNPPRHASTDYAVSGSHFKSSQSRPYPTASGPGSFRHPLPNYQFDPGTSRVTSGNISASSHSSDPRHMSSHSVSPVQSPPEFPYCSPEMNNIHNHFSHARGDGSGSLNGTSRMDQETVEPVLNEAVDSRSHKRQSKVSDQVSPQVAVGIVESLEAGGVAASTSSRRNQAAVAARNSTHGAGGPSGIVNSDFLGGDLNLHLELLAYGRRCEDHCSSSPQLPIAHPAYGWEQHSHMHGSWEGPGRPAQFMVHPAFNSSGPVWPPPSPIQQQPGHNPQLQTSWGRQVMELSSRPRGRGTYLPNS